jgi:hypothetical protein
MRSRYGPETILLASKKPRIKELIEKSKNLTEDEIKSLNEKPDVIRGLLLIKEFGDDGIKLTIPEKIANRMQRTGTNSHHATTIDGKIYQIISESVWVPINSTHLEVRKGWYWAWLETKQILVSSNYIPATSNVLNLLLPASKLVSSGTTADLKQLEDTRRNSLI